MFQSNFKLWAKFREEIDGLTSITYTPVVGWVKDDGYEGENKYIALVLCMYGSGNGLTEFAFPVNSDVIHNDYGNFECYVNDSNIERMIAQSNEWALKDEDNRYVGVYPKP